MLSRRSLLGSLIKESFGHRGYCCTLGHLHRALRGRSRATAEWQHYLCTSPSPPSALDLATPHAAAFTLIYFEIVE
jgi:hypothetical protein